MAPIKVFVAYADTYVGRQLARQFVNKPHLYTLYACTWSQDVDTVRDMLVMSDGSSGVPDADIDSNGGSNTVSGTADVGASNSTLMPSVAGIEAAAVPGIALLTPFPTTNTAAASASLRVFDRRDISAVRRALVACDWIVVEQRDAQSVLSLLECVTQSSFEKTKRFVVLSNFMSWYATKSLNALEDDANADAEGENATNDEEVVVDDEEAEEIGAPYPPPPDNDAQEQRLASEAAAAAAGDLVAVLEETTEEDAEAADGEGMEKEVLTEDQYNRRIPHIKYFNFRDAERAVAAAHHANGLPLETFVVFAGLAYGEEECALEPFFRQAWCGQSTVGDATLPVYGDGRQRVPMIHVRDLATMTRKLLRCPVSELPNPSLRYLFATDGASLSWLSIIRSINAMFGNRLPLQPVTSDDYPLHQNVELFTVDLRVDQETSQALMARQDVHPDEAPKSAAGDAGESESSWAAEGGFRKSAKRLSLEYRRAHHITPLRLALLGPPLSGKTYLAQKLAAHYQLPSFTMDDVIAGYREACESKRAEIANYRTQLVEGELTRRQNVKRRRVLMAARAGLPTRTEIDKGGELGADAEDDDTTRLPQTGEAFTTTAAHSSSDDDDVEEAEEIDFALTEAEEAAAEEVMQERFEASPLVAQWRAEVGAMERVLLMRLMPPDAQQNNLNPKKRGAQTKKKLTKEQQKKKEEEDLQQAKEALQDAPFQPKALALMLQWRLRQPDVANQGYILDGFPETVECARLAFGADDLQPPSTEEEALQQPPPAPPIVGREGADDEEDERDGSAAQPTVETSSEQRLPDYVVVLEAEENYLIDRLAAIGQLRSQTDGCGSAGGEVGTGVTSEGDAQQDLLHHFNEKMDIFRREVVEPAYSLMSFFDCAVTAPTSVTGGGRRPVVRVLPVQETEPLVPPPPPPSRFQEPALSEAELEMRLIIGAPHNFGKTPLQIHREVVREQALAEETRQASLKRENDTREKEQCAYEDEATARAVTDSHIRQAKKADLAELDARRAPLQAYLSQSILPLLTKGLVEVCAQRPENPVDFLAEWLLRHNPRDDIFQDL